MKKIFLFLLPVIVILSFIGCVKNPELYSQTDGLYFGADSVAYSFALYPQKTIDTVHIPVNVLGKPLGVDRPISVSIATGPLYNAVSGVHYKLLSNPVMPANAVTTTIPVVVYRTPDLDSTAVKFAFKINQNSGFPGQGITANQTVIVNLAYIQKPATWGTLTGLPWAGYSANFGTWTKTKYKLILAALYNPATGTTVTEFPVGSRFAPPLIYSQYLALVRDYILTNYPGNYGLPGATLTDPDANNQVIKVGPANY
jgi:hypothetical protein